MKPYPGDDPLTDEQKVLALEELWKFRIVIDELHLDDMAPATTKDKTGGATA